MTDERMFDLTIKALENGGFELWQQTGPDEADVIHLHPCQIRLLAERAGLLSAPDPGLIDRLSARHVRRIHELAERVRELRNGYTDEIVSRCGYGIEICLHLDAIEGMVLDLVEDCDRGTAQTPIPVTECHDKSAAISVTPPKRGRPKKEDALTPAERQRAHRAKQGEPATAQQALALTTDHQNHGATA